MLKRLISFIGERMSVATATKMYQVLGIGFQVSQGRVTVVVER